MVHDIVIIESETVISMENQELINTVSQRLRTINPYRAILFGSLAYGDPNDDSDLDIIVVLNKSGLPGSFQEKMENHRHVRRLLRDLNKNHPFDVVVYTIDEWNSFIATGSSFSKNVIQRGRSIA